AFSKYKNYTIQQGSVAPGQIGNYSSVHPDYKPDLEITYVPSTLSREYLRYFTGTQYSSEGWTAASGYMDPDCADAAAKAAKAQGQPFHKMAIKSLDIITNSALLPYYTDLDSNSFISFGDDNHIGLDIAPGIKYEIEYYDLPEEPIDDTEYRDFVRQNYMEVPDENRALIANLCVKEGFSADDPDLDKKLADYFQNNYTYTLDPGLVPWQTDFVNYFLFDTKQGLCAHFASAGTLIYRTLGIPARYAEGYVIDYPLEREEQTVLEDENTADWYGGNRPLTEHPVKITLSDFKAHAWVEIYRDGYGWTPVELTPVDFGHDYEEKSDDLEIAEKLAKLMLINKDDTSPKEIDTSLYKKQFEEILGYIGFAAVLAALICIFVMALKTILRHALRLYRFSKRDSNSVIALFGYITSILAYLGKIETTSFKAADKALLPYMRSPEAVTDIVQQILYSPEPVPKEDCENACISLHTALEKIFAQCKPMQKLKIIFKI
ncbi:MAG: transglutaminase domain-containing protein, partial [Firmicutes bacterium]|nr:transglutaminase domain-containing protein [Bacillota bacterium]